MIAQPLWFAKSASTLSAAVYTVLTLGLCGGSGGDIGFAAEAQESFAAFKSDVDIDIEDGEVEFMCTFTLGPGSNGIDPSKEAVSLHLKGGSGTYSVTIPAGSFKKDRTGFAFQGTIDGVRLRASFRPQRDGVFAFELENERAKLKGFANPVAVSLVVGDDGGSQTVKAKIE
jgi:hypothetical protein